VRTNLTKAERMKIMCLITLDAHSRDICQNLLEGKVCGGRGLQGLQGAHGLGWEVGGGGGSGIDER
jgi:hypothetical protein